MPKRLLLPLAIAVLVLASCNGDDPKASPGATTTTAQPGATPTTPVPPSATTSTSIAEDEPPPVTGRSFGFITEFGQDEQGDNVQLDLAVYYTGADADRAAQEDKKIGKGERLPNGFYVRNLNPKLHFVRFGPAAAIKVAECTDTCRAVTADLQTLKSRPRPLAVNLTIVHGIVVLAEEQHLG